MKQLLSIALFSFLAQGAVASAQSSVFDPFDGGVNNGGWNYNPGDTILPTGGNPGAWLHQSTADTFAPIFRSTSKDLDGDWRAAGIDRISFDAILNGMNFGNGSGFAMSILLRDTKGSSGVSDDDYAYFVGPNIPLLGAGWKSFIYSIPSQDTSAVPTGWKGGWVGDGAQFRPGVDWNDVITNVDRVEIQWIDPSFFALFQQWDIGMDNIGVQADGTAVVRNGAGGNPLGFVSTSTPDIGSAWTSTVDVLGPGHPLSFVAVSLDGPINGIFPGGGLVGELLVLPNFFAIDIQAGAHSFPMPLDPSLFGIGLATQGGTVDGSGTIHLNNAIDLIIGG
jgi:hypothetical protein